MPHYFVVRSTSMKLFFLENKQPKHHLSIALGKHLDTLKEAYLKEGTSVDTKDWQKMDKLYKRECVMRRLGLLDILIKQLNQFEEGRAFLDELTKRVDVDMLGASDAFAHLAHHIKFEAPILRKQAKEAGSYFEGIGLSSLLLGPLGLMLSFIGLLAAATSVWLTGFGLLLPILVLATTVMPELYKRQSVLAPLNRFMADMGYEEGRCYSSGGVHDYKVNYTLFQNFVRSTSPDEPVKTADVDAKTKEASLTN